MATAVAGDMQKPTFETIDLQHLDAVTGGDAVDAAIAVGEGVDQGYQAIKQAGTALAPVGKTTRSALHRWSKHAPGILHRWGKHV